MHPIPTYMYIINSSLHFLLKVISLSIAGLLCWWNWSFISQSVASGRTVFWWSKETLPEYFCYGISPPFCSSFPLFCLSFFLCGACGETFFFHFSFTSLKMTNHNFSNCFFLSANAKENERNNMLLHFAQDTTFLWSYCYLRNEIVTTKLLKSQIHKTFL